MDVTINNTALNTYLEPFNKFFSIDGVNEVAINRPCEVWIEKHGELYCEKVPELDYIHLRGMANLISRSTEQTISEERPILSATLPNGYRVQVIIPPACEQGMIGYAIRKPSVIKWSLDDYDKMGAFSKTATAAQEDPNDYTLSNYLNKGDIKSFLYYGVLYRKNLIISGGTSTGKTTFANALLRAIPKDERIITVEDAREIDLSGHPNRLHLLASKGGQGRANVTIQDLIEACLRLRPDRIIIGELRGAEAFSFLRAINTGHPGSIATVHADEPKMALEQLKLMVMQAGLGMPPSEIKDYIHHVVEVIAQLKRGSGGQRFVSEVYFKNKKSGQTESIKDIHIEAKQAQDIISQGVNDMQAKTSQETHDIKLDEEGNKYILQTIVKDGRRVVVKKRI